MIKIGLIGTQSMHAWSFAQVCNLPDSDGNYLFPDTRVTAVYGVDDTQEHLAMTLEKGNIPFKATTFEEMFQHCNAFMVLQRRGSEHLKYAAEIIRRGYPVFIDKPVCCSTDDLKELQSLALEHNAVICGGSGLKHCKQVVMLKRQLEAAVFGRIRSATVIHSADIDSPYDGIFFYLPHAVEVMLELFGYDPVSVNTTVLSHNNFTISVKYNRHIVNLVLNGSASCIVAINGRSSNTIRINDSDIFVESMRNFVNAIHNQENVNEINKLTRHVEVILAIEESIYRKSEVRIEKQ